MIPHMSDAELSLFKAFLAKSARYLEFGAGGGTVLACAQPREWVISVESSRDWVDRVDAECVGAPTMPILVHADIGPVGEWGYPIDRTAQAKWIGYHFGVWNWLPQSREADFVLVDGRFRVACVAQSVLHCGPTTRIAVHDFASRPDYHIIHEIAEEIAAAEDLAVFIPRPGARERAAAVWAAFRETPQ